MTWPCGSAITLLTGPDHDNFRRVQSNEELIIEEAVMPDFKKAVFYRYRKSHRKKIVKKHHKHPSKIRRY